MLEWKECEGADQLPYREKFSVDWAESGKSLYIFGGCDENGKVMNDMYLFDLGNFSVFDGFMRNNLLEKKKVENIGLFSRQWTEKDQIPCLFSTF